MSAIASFSLVKQGFFPDSTRAQFVVDYSLPEGSSIEQTEKDILAISQWVRKLDGVTGSNTAVGSGHMRFQLTYASESASAAYSQILVDVDSYMQIDDMLPVIQSHIDQNYPNATSKVWKFVLGPGGGSQIEARFAGPDPVILRQLSEQAKSVYFNAGAASVKDDWRDMVKVVRPKINEQNARRAGLSQSDISKAIAELFQGSTLGVYRE